MTIVKKFILLNGFKGEPKLTDFKLVEERLPALKDGEVLFEALYHSVDPYMRVYMAHLPLGSTMIGGQIARVIESKSKEYPKGAVAFGQFGWTTHTIFDPSKPNTEMLETQLLPNFGNHPVSLGIGLLGMPGFTAYFGLFEMCKPKVGEVVVVTAAAGAVGSIVGQLAKIKGCTVIGFAGDDKKCEWLKGELGFDHVINYKTADTRQALLEAAPNGVDCYFDNVGGDLSSQIISQMRDYGRIAVCGAISSYNRETPEILPKSPILQPMFVFKQLKMEGVAYTRFLEKVPAAFIEMKNWLDEGKLKYRETITEGFENMPQAFIDMLKGKNTGKAIVKSLF